MYLMTCSVQCWCRPDMVRIDMECFVKRFQPELLDMWKEGLDMAPHPNDESIRMYGPRARGKLIGRTENVDPDYIISG